MKQHEKIIQAANVALNLEAESELETIAGMFELVEQSGSVRDVQQLSDDLLSREIYQRTTTDNCALLFHVSSRSVPHLEIYFGRFAKGIGYYTQAGHPIDLVFLIVAHPNEIGEFNAVVEKLENALQNPFLRNSFRTVQEKTSIVRQIENIVSKQTTQTGD